MSRGHTGVTVQSRRRHGLGVATLVGIAPGPDLLFNLRIQAELLVALAYVLSVVGRVRMTCLLEVTLVLLFAIVEEFGE